MFYLYLCFVSLFSQTECDEWPTYKHPDNSRQLCYGCPPMFYLRDHCAIDRNHNPGYPECGKCTGIEFTSSWHSKRCWEKQECSSDEKIAWDGGNTGPTVCECKVGKAKFEETGVCEDAVQLSNYTKSLEEVKKAYQRTKIQVPPTHPAHVTVLSKTSTPCPVQPTPTLYTAGFEEVNDMGFLLGLLVGSLSSAVLFAIGGSICMYKRKTSKRKNVSQNAPPTELVTARGTEDEARPLLPPSDQVGQSSSNLTVDMPPAAASAQQTRTSNPTSAGTADTRTPKHSTGTPPFQREESRDAAFRVIESKIVTVADFGKLARNVLQISLDEYHRIRDRSEHKDISDKVRDALATWVRVRGSEATVPDLLASLRKNEYNDVADEIENNLGIPHTSGERGKNKGDDLDRAFALCESKIKTRDAKRFLRGPLKLEITEVEQFPEGNVIRTGLSTWRQKMGKYATVDTFLSCLEKGGLQEIADTIRGRPRLNYEKSDENTGCGDGPEDEQQHAMIYKNEKSADNAAVPIRTHLNQPMGDQPGPIQEPPSTERGGAAGANRTPLSPDNNDTSDQPSTSGLSGGVRPVIRRDSKEYDKEEDEEELKDLDYFDEEHEDFAKSVPKDQDRTKKK